MTKKKDVRLGHNSLNAEQLKSIIDRVDTLEEEKSAIVTDIKEVFAEAKGNGFHVPTIKAIRKVMAMDESKRAEAQALFETYANALGIDPFS